MDHTKATQSLAEIRRREQQTVGTFTDDLLPWWYVAGIAVALVAYGVAHDVETTAYSTLGFVAAAGVFLWGTWAQSRRARVQLPHWTATKRSMQFSVGVVVAGGIVFALVEALVRYVGHLPWPSTISSAVAGGALVATTPLVKRGYRAALRGSGHG